MFTGSVLRNTTNTLTCHRWLVRKAKPKLSTSNIQGNKNPNFSCSGRMNGFSWRSRLARFHLDIQPSTSHCCAYKLASEMFVSCCPPSPTILSSLDSVQTWEHMRKPVSTIYSELSLYPCVLNFSVSSTFRFSRVLMNDYSSLQRSRALYFVKPRKHLRGSSRSQLWLPEGSRRRIPEAL